MRVHKKKVCVCMYVCVWGGGGSNTHINPLYYALSEQILKTKKYLELTNSINTRIYCNTASQ